MYKNKNFYCVIMAGGVGSRFWPVSRNAMPKQFLDITGVGKSFLQQTFDRFSKLIPVSNILIVTSSSYKEIIMRQLPKMLPQNILLEPFRRNTAPCIAYAVMKIMKINPEATMVVAPSDHYIANEDLFLDTINSAMKYSSDKDELFTIGIKPTRPETGYGYIQSDIKQSRLVDGDTVYKVKTFTEKPNQELAKVFVDSGEFLWNSGIFIWNVKAISEALEEYLPEIYKAFTDVSEYLNTNKEQSFIDKVYEECTGISIDYGVMEKTTKALVFQASFGWSDLGTWESLFIHSDKDSSDNMIKADECMIEGTKESIIVSNEKGKLIVIKGLDNYMIINTDDVLMICPRDEKQFKEVITDLPLNNKSKYQ